MGIVALPNLDVEPEILPDGRERRFAGADWIAHKQEGRTVSTDETQTVTLNNARNKRYGEIFVEQKMVYSKGKPVYELVDPDNHAYVLQARDEAFPMESLATLGDKLKLPEGWKYRSRVLDEDLALDLGPDKTIYAVGDDFHRYYTRI